MLARIFKKTPARRKAHPALARLNQFGTRSALATVKVDENGQEVHEEIGLVSFYGRPSSIYHKNGIFYLAPPAGYDYATGALRGRGEQVELAFQHRRTPFSLKCIVRQRVRFTEKLLEVLEPRVSIGFKLEPIGSVVKNEHRRSLRFAHVRGVKSPTVAPNFRFDAYVERVALAGDKDGGPFVLPYSGEDSVPEEVKACDTPEEMASLFHRMIRLNPEQYRKVHITKPNRDSRNGRTDLAYLGEGPVLGLDGEPKEGTQIHVRRPSITDGETLREGDVAILNFTWRDLMKNVDIQHNWICRVCRSGVKVMTFRPKGIIRRQTGLPVLVRDFSVSGLSIQNSPLLETYLLEGREIATNPEVLLEQLIGTGLLFSFYPRLHYPGDLSVYRPNIPPHVPIIGEIVRGQIDSGKDEGRVANLGIAFRFDPADHDPTTYGVSAWEPLRALRDNLHFKETHRALNGMLAFIGR